jgi:hypothetical protein
MDKIARVWNRFVFTGCSAEELGVLRILLGIGLIPFHYFQFKRYLNLDLDGAGFYFVEPIWFFRPFGIEALDPVGCLIAFGILTLATVGFAAGFFTRSSLVTMLLCILYLKGMRDSVAGDVHHRYLIPFNMLLFFLLSRCGDVLSIDSLRARGKSALDAVSEWQASWPIRASQLYIASFYFWSAIAKARMTGMGWVDGGTRLQDLLVTRSIRYGYEDGVVEGGSQLAFDLAHNTTVSHMLGGLTYVFEFGFPLILLIRDFRLRILFFLSVTFFHAANYVLINVQFALLPIVFIVFFDVAAPLRYWRERRAAVL